MLRGFQENRDYKESLQLSTLRLLRMCGYATLQTIPLKRGKSLPSITTWYPLPFDREKVKMTKEQMIEIFLKKDPVITNGKLRGYTDKNGNFEMIN